MNILYHHRTQAKGVEGVHIRELVRALRAQGHRVDVVGPPSISTDELQSKREPGFLVWSYQQISRFLPEFVFELLEMSYGVAAVGRLRRILESQRYDLIFERYAIFNWSGVASARSAGVPIILEVNYTARTPIHRRRNRLLKPFARWIDRRVFRRADAFVVVSSYLQDHLETVYRVPREKIVVLPNAADPEYFSPGVDGGPVRKKLGLEGKTVIGFVGGYYPWHGLDFYCSALASLELAGQDIASVFIGDGPEKATIKKLVAELGMEHRFRFVDPVPHRELPRYLAAFDIAVMPNSNDYGSPMKIFEYMSMGIPVIAPRLAPLVDVIDDGVEGLLFEPENRGLFSKALKALIEDGALRERVGGAARKKILARHNWAANASAVVQLYDRLYPELPLRA